MSTRGNLVCIQQPNLNPWVKKELGITGNFEENVGLCVMKMYDGDLESFKLNQSAEFIGTLSYTPLTKEDQLAKDERVKEDGYLPNNEFQGMSKYPSIHVIAHIPSPETLVATPLNVQFESLTIEIIGSVRDTLFECFRDMCFGDEIVAEYMLCNLIQRIHNRQDDATPLGSLNINLYSTEEEEAMFISDGV